MSKVIMDEIAMKRALTRITYEIIENNQGVDNLLICGIKTRGAILGQRIAQRMQQLEQVDVDVTELDISNYRDDRESTDNENMNSFNPSGKTVILVDDVLYTGRTIRAAMDAIISQGRPQKIKLAVLIDRGHRELPIRPDFIGKNIPTAKTERIRVLVSEIDGQDGVQLN